MSRTCQQVFDAALLKSVANESDIYTSAFRELLDRMDRAQQMLFTRLADESRYFYVRVASINSSAAASGRVLDLSTQTPEVERVLKLVLPNGQDINRVDLQDIGAEFAPRAYPLGATMVEVGAEWSATPGAVAITVSYVYRPAALNLTATDLSQTITVPDRFASYLVDDLAWYMASKDFGRGMADASELQRLEAEREATLQSFLAFLDHFPGTQAQRFVLPTPARGSKQ